jgi:rifampicin phosphotransferase
MHTLEPTILSLANAAPILLHQVGGKAANLGELIRAGFQVPDGFCITTSVYRRVTDLAQVKPLLAELQQLPVQDLEGRAALAERLRQRIQTAPAPADLVDAITSAYLALGQDVAVAVRSSATAEDLAEAAFAGQQDTFLNIVGPDAVLDAVRHCWASLWTDRAIAYRERQGVDPQTVALAVVIQRLVAAEAAGVMFTANAITGARDETVIDSSPGLGEAVVSGQVTPDHIVLRKSRWGWRVIERQPGRREIVIRARPGGGTEHVPSGTGMALPPLPDHRLRQLAGIGEAIQRHFGTPQDVEWAWAGGKLMMLQARPMTALPEPVPHLVGPMRMLAAMFAEMFPVRPYPLDQTAWVPALSAGAVEPMFRLLGIKVPSIATFFIVEDGVVVRFSGKIEPRLTPAVLLAPVRILQMAFRYDPRHWREDAPAAEARSRVRALEARDLQALSWPEMLAVVQEALALPAALAGEPRRRYLPRALIGAGLLRVILGLIGRGRLFGALVSGVESQTLAANRALAALAGRVRSDPALSHLFATNAADELMVALAAQSVGQAFLVDLREFLDQFGHRELVLSTAMQPTWKDAPEIVLVVIQGFTQSPPPQTGRPAWESAQTELLAHPVLRYPRGSAAFLALIRTARAFFLVREDTHFEVTRVLPILRRTLLDLGRRLAEADVLESAEAVFHLTLDELTHSGDIWPPPPPLAGELRGAVQRRQARRAALEGTPVVDPRFYQQPEAGGDALLTGTPGSPGVAEGPVRVIRTPADFGKLRSGEVLVAPYTNPAWTPLFQSAAAVVVDGGAATSHAAIVAREYGIPAVMGTVTGTQILRDGERVRVDGNQGRVTRLE